MTDLFNLDDNCFQVPGVDRVFQLRLRHPRPAREHPRPGVHHPRQREHQSGRCCILESRRTDDLGAGGQQPLERHQAGDHVRAARRNRRVRAR